MNPIEMQQAILGIRADLQDHAKAISDVRQMALGATGAIKMIGDRSNQIAADLQGLHVVINKTTEFLEREVFPRVGDDVAVEWDWIRKEHNQAAISASYLGQCTITALSRWGKTGTEPEVLAHIAEVDDDGTVCAHITAHPDSPLFDAWEGQTRIGADKGALLREIAAKVKVQRDRLIADGAYEGSPYYHGEATPEPPQKPAGDSGLIVVGR